MGISGSGFPFEAFLAGAFINAIPGIIVQVVIIPVLVMIVDKSKYAGECYGM